jgi:Transcriptional regulator
MDLNWLMDFLALAETRNFSRAAEKSHVTQPAFSRRIRNMEEWLGTPLFIRGRHRVELTRAGKEIHSEVEAVLRAVFRMKRMAQEFSEQSSATLHFAATYSLSLVFFPEWIRQYTQKIENFSINLTSDSMAACEAILMQGGVQFLICHDSASAPSRFALAGFDSRVIGKDILVPYCAPKPDGSPLWVLGKTPRDMVAWLKYNNDSGFFRMMQGHQKISGLMAASEPHFISSIAAVLLSIARDGKGVAWLPESLAAPSEQSGQIVRAGDEAWCIPLDIKVFRTEEHPSMGAHQFWKLL